MPPTSGRPAITLDLGDGVAPARRAVSAIIATRGWSGLDRADDLILALSEIMTNSILHGKGRRELRVWTHSGTVTCEVSDGGDGPADPMISYRPPTTDAIGGRGLWIAQQLCDALAIARRGGTTVVRFAVTLLKDQPRHLLQHASPTG
jgi:anti-sigma regulatory factor (Ser/Thr protein kinase)